MRSLDRFRPGDAFFLSCAAVIVAALILGGGTRSGHLSDVILQLLAIPLLLVSLWRLADLPSLGNARASVIFCAAVLLVPLLQAVPLPPVIWSNLPHRQAEVEAFALAGQPLPWMPMSLSPEATMLSALALMVPVSIFLGTLLLDYEQRAKLSLVILAVGVLSVFLGLSQVAQGPESSLRFFDFSNPTEAVGFFANRNHFASLLCALTLLAGAWAVNAALSAGSSPAGKTFAPANFIPILASFIVLVALIAGQAMARSRGGLALTIVALLGTFALVFTDRRGASGVTPTRVLAGSIALAAMFATQFALYRIMERFGTDPMQDGRIAFARTTLEQAKQFMPLGSGMGTFVPVYAMFERPGDLMINSYANRAHDDILELWLETGVVGLGLMALFIVWLLFRSVAIWREPAKNARDIDSCLARAATLAVVLILAHSVVDYPLRTAAMAAVFAYACALLVDPPGMRREAPASRAERGVARGPSPFAQASPAPVWSAPVWSAPTEPIPPSAATPKGAFNPQPVGTLWEDMEWPEEWRKSAKPGPRGPGDKS